MLFFLALPSDILILVISHLSLTDLLSLTAVCHKLHALVRTLSTPTPIPSHIIVLTHQVNEFGGRNILRTFPRPSKSLAKSLSLWRPMPQVKYHTLSDRSWEKQRFVARPLSRPWKGKLQPLLATNKSRFFVAAGHTLYP